MQNKRQNASQPSYRKQLIQLAKFYGIIEIKNYFKSAKRLTNAQIELILIKNKIKLPSKKILSKLGHLIIFKNKYLKQLFYTAAVAIVVIGFFGGAPYLIKVFHKIDYDLWKNKDEIAKHKNDSIDNILKKSEIKPYDDEENFVLTENIQKKQNDLVENTVSLNASVVASLFEDLDYDLSKIRKGKKVKPFYISLLPKDLSLIEDSKERKELFIKIVLPLILHENNKIEKDRKELFRVLAKKSNTKEEKNWLKWKFKEYKIENSDISELKIRMDIIPASLAIAQAAKESGWGTSRFALEGNNLYGIKTWTKTEPNMLPLGKQDSRFSMRVFLTKCDSVKEYVRILNNHPAHKEFRNKRLETKNAIKLAPTLTKYSELGDEYTRRLISVIKYIRKHYDI